MLLPPPPIKTYLFERQSVGERGRVPNHWLILQIVSSEGAGPLEVRRGLDLHSWCPDGVQRPSYLIGRCFSRRTSRDLDVRRISEDSQHVGVPIWDASNGLPGSATTPASTCSTGIRLDRVCGSRMPTVQEPFVVEHMYKEFEALSEHERDCLPKTPTDYLPGPKCVMAIATSN